MKHLFFITLLCCSLSVAFAQTQPFQKGQLEAKLGIGFINTLNINIADAGIQNFKSKFDSPPIIASLLYGITDNISIGGQVTYAKTSLMFYDEPVQQDKYVFVGARGAYHVTDIHPKCDIYVGGALLFGHVSTDQNIAGEMASGTSSGLYYQVFAGAKYRFAERLGVFAELGYGISVGTIGLSFNLK